jgi:hypothetical protein
MGYNWAAKKKIGPAGDCRKSIIVRANILIKAGYKMQVKKDRPLLTSHSHQAFVVRK